MSTLFDRQIREGRIRALLPTYKRLLKDTQDECKAFAWAHRPAMLSLSWGKDSIVLAHILFTHGIKIPCVFFRQEDSQIVDNFDEVRDQFLERWPIDYREVTGGKLRDAGREYRATGMYGGVFLGLTAEESRARRMSTAKGWLRWSDGVYRCTPLRRWEWRDIAAHVAVHNLPMLHTYHQFGFEARTSASLRGERSHIGMDRLSPTRQRLYKSN